MELYLCYPIIDGFVLPTESLFPSKYWILSPPDSDTCKLTLVGNCYHRRYLNASQRTKA